MQDFESIKRWLQDNFNKCVKDGENDYNLFSVLRKNDDEVGLHSAFIFSLLDTGSEHYQKGLFLGLFLEIIGQPNFFDDMVNVIVKKQDRYNDESEFDIIIENTNKCIVIENKVNVKDTHGQIDRYIEDLSLDDKKEFLFIYLTKDGSKPKYTKKYEFDDKNDNIRVKSGKILQNGSYRLISYDKEIREWIEKCLEKSVGLENLSIYLKAYLEIIDKIYGKYRSLKVDIELLKTGEDYKILKNIVEIFENDKKMIYEKFLTNLENLFNEKYKEFELKNMLTGNQNRNFEKRYACFFKITEKNKNNFFMLWFDFGKIDCKEPGFGIRTEEEEKFNKEEIYKLFTKEEIKKIKGKNSNNHLYEDIKEEKFNFSE